ncbi:MAG: DNA polymerase III subunit gamma/tau [Proteobacteria bacterium]|nr:DNA polymerase III subunit gamma/tau [Pseudomonadota bacterium]
MSYTALARKWRPKSFAEMSGQEHVLKALANALDAGRVHHAFLFTGTRGVGKTTIARIFAKCLNCETGMRSVPCGTCASCQEIDAGRFLDLIEVDAASRTKVDDTRELLENVQYAPSRGRYKVYLIDEVHMLSTSSFNALLKTLEEPPPHVKFLLATTDPQKLPATVLSRCLQFNLKRLTPALISSRLAHVLQAEGMEAESAALQLLAQAADGSLRDALSLLDQLLAFGNGAAREADAVAMLGTVDRSQVTRLAQLLAAQDAAGLVAQARDLEQFSPDYAQLLDELNGLLAQVAVLQVVPDSTTEDSLYAPALLQSLAATIAPQDLQLYYQIGLLGRRDLALLADTRLGFLMTLVRMLAFRPQAATTAAPAQLASAAGQGTRMPTAPATARPATMGVGASSAAPAVAAPVATRPADPAALAALTAADWQGLAERLDLRGVTRQLAAHCALTAVQGSTLRLALDPRQKQLLNAQSLERLGQALSAHYGMPVRTEIDTNAAVADTPAAAQDRQARQRMDTAAAGLAGDPLVKALADQFGATLLPESVRLTPTATAPPNPVEDD